MLDVYAQSSNGMPEVAKFVVKMSGEEGGGKILEVDLAEEITTEEEAAAIDRLIPGAARLWRSSMNAQEANRTETELNGAAAGAQAGSAGKEPFGQYTVPSGHSGARFVFGSDDHVIDAGNTEIISVRLKSTPRACLYVVKVRVLGMDRDGFMQFFDWLQKSVNVTITQAQAVLPFRRKIPGQIGEVVSGIHMDKEYAGIIVSRGNEPDGETIEVDDCGKHFVVPAATIAGAFQVVAEGRDEQLTTYVRKCKRLKLPASWTSLVAALGRAHMGRGEVGDWNLTDSIVEDAVTAQQGDNGDGAKANRA